MTGSGSSVPRGGDAEAALPALASGTSADFLGPTALPRGLRGRRCFFIMGPLGVGKTRVARGLAGRDALEWSEQRVRGAIAAVHRGAPWPEILRRAPCVILHCPDKLEAEPRIRAGVQQLLRLREASGGWTAVVQSRQGASMTDLMAVVAPKRRATIALRFPTGDARLAFARSLCAQHGLPGERAEETVTIEPWSYSAVWSALGLSTEAEPPLAPARE